MRQYSLYSFFQIIVLMLSIVCSSFAAPNFLTITDVHYGSKNTSGEGHDTGDELFFTTLNKLKELSQDVDFILTLGDLPTHMLGYSPEKEEYEKVVFHGLFEANVPHKPMFYISGNNDSLAGNYQAFEYNGKSPLTCAMDWSGACAYCDGLIIDDSHMKSGGYYSSYVIPNNKEVILIVLNTIQWTKAPTFTSSYLNQDIDALVQLSWLKEQLQKNHAKQLLIAMHIPPGNNITGKTFWHAFYAKKFINLLAQYKHLYGQISLITSHTHMEEFRKIQLSGDDSIYAYSTPAVSRVYHNNSAMKVFHFNADWAIKDFTTYYTTSDQKWGQDQYHGLSAPDAILPNCQEKTLAQCLDGLSESEVCSYLEKGAFYGVKSPNVRNGYCSIIYSVVILS